VIFVEVRVHCSSRILVAQHISAPEKSAENRFGLRVSGR
jgi:hypothetical protein